MRTLDEADLGEYGVLLGEAIFCGEVGDTFLMALGQSAGELHVSLGVEDEVLKTLRWERLCGPLDGRPMKPLALDRRVFYAIRLTAAKSRQIPYIEGEDIRALVVAANPPTTNPYGLEPFDADAAVAAVVTSLSPIPTDILGQDTSRKGPPTLDALCRALTDRRYALLHVVGHGRYASKAGEPVLYLLDDAGSVRPTGATELTDRLSQVLGAKGLHFAFLSCCDSAAPEAERGLGGLGQRLVRELGVPAVLAMTDRISVRSAVGLAAAFYRRLLAHGEPDRALVEAYAGLGGRHDMRFTVPALFSRLRGRPLFSPDVPLVDEILDYLDALAERVAELPGYFPPHLREREGCGTLFDAVRQTVQVVEDRAAWDRWRAGERERARAAGYADSRLAYAPGRTRPEDHLGGRNSAARGRDRPPPPPVPWDESAAARFPRAVILGDPGFGKSWLLRYEARRLARNADRALREGTGLDSVTLPLYARLSDLNRTDGPLEEALADGAGEGRSQAFRRFILRKLEVGGAIALLDAWDEVPVEVPPPGQPVAYAPHHRQRLGQRVEAFARRHVDCRILLTSRIVGYNGSLVPEARELELFAFDPPQIEAFVRTWFRGDEAAGPFLELLHRDPQVSGLARIPLMLTLLCRAYSEQLCPPAPSREADNDFTRRVPLYRLCLRGLLRDWRAERERRSIGDAYVDAVLEVLAPAALALFAGGYEQFDEGLLREHLLASIGGLKPGHEVNGRDAAWMIAELKLAGILVTSGEHRDAPLLFLHRTFHEYLAALALNLQVRQGGWVAVSGLLDRKAWRPIWHEVIVLLAGQLSDPEPLLRMLADRRRDDLLRHRLALAALCLGELPAEALDSDLVDEVADGVIRSRLELLLGDETEDSVTHLTRALAGVGRIWSRTAGGSWESRLLGLCRHRRPERRAMAPAFLGALGAGAAEPALDQLLDLLRDPEWSVQEAAVAALGGLGHAAALAVGRLLEMTREKDSEEDIFVRSAAAQALGALGPAAAPALDRLLEMTREEDPYVKSRAAQALGALGPAAVPALDRLLEMTYDTDSGVRSSAASALSGVGGAAAKVLDRLLEMTREEERSIIPDAIDAIGGLGTAAAPALGRLLELTRDTDPYVRWKAVRALQGLGPAAAPALDRLVDLLRDKDKLVRLMAAEALGDLSGAVAPALNRLVAVSRDKDPDVRGLAARVLGHLGGAATPALDRLVDLLFDIDDSVSLEAERALRNLGQAAAPALPRLRQLARNWNPFVREAATGALKPLKPIELLWFRRPVWSRWILGDRVVLIDELDPDHPVKP